MKNNIIERLKQDVLIKHKVSDNILAEVADLIDCYINAACECVEEEPSWFSKTDDLEKVVETAGCHSEHIYDELYEICDWQSGDEDVIDSIVDIAHELIYEAAMKTLKVI